MGTRKTVIIVNRHLVAKNRRDGGKRPIYAVKQGGKILYAHGVSVSGRLTFIDPRSEPPLSCGATVYAVADGEITLVEPTPYANIEESQS